MCWGAMFGLVLLLWWLREERWEGVLVLDISLGDVPRGGGGADRPSVKFRWWSPLLLLWLFPDATSGCAAASPPLLCGGGSGACRPLVPSPSPSSRRRVWEAFTRFLLLITSVLREMGRGRPWSLRKRPQALQSTDPDSSRRHSGVVEVPQF